MTRTLSTSKRKQVLLAHVDLSAHSDRALIRGVGRFLRRHGHWIVCTTTTHLPPTVERIGDFTGDGVIAALRHATQLDDAIRAGLPLVNVSSFLPDVPFPRVVVDNHAVGRCAAEHLQSLGLQQFAYLGLRGAVLSQHRYAGFVKQIGNPSCVAAADVPGGTPVGIEEFTPQARHALATWLRQLPKPVGLFAFNDLFGLRVVQACRELDILVPEDVAVVGADNIDMLCDLSDPPLSSVSIPFPRIGYEAADVLARMMTGQREVPRETHVPPLGVVPRQSTDTIAVSDKDVVAAMRVIRNHVREGINVQAVLSKIDVPRRSLERKFLRVLGISPHDAIKRARLDVAKQLLAETEMPIWEVTERAGFGDVKRFEVAFREAMQVTPRAYRRQLRGSEAVNW